MSDAYARNEHLPSDMRRQLPEDAQDAYRLAYNAAIASGKRSAEASRAAWDAVELGWQKAGPREQWIRKGTVQ